MSQKHLLFPFGRSLKVWFSPFISNSLYSSYRIPSKNTVFKFKSFKTSSVSNMATKVAGYGSWISPITSDVVSKGGISLSHDIDISKDGEIFWLEMRSAEGGRCVICSSNSDKKDKIDWTPEGYNARTKASEYGGGAFCASEDGVVYFSNFKDQRLYRQIKSDSIPEPVTEDKNGDYMYGDGHYVSAFKKIVTVREDHSGVASKDKFESENTIVSIDPETKEQNILVNGADFYGSPVVSNDGTKLVWVQWNHPNMPWDSTEIFFANLNEGGTAILKDTVTKVAGGKDNSVILPKWSPEGDLYFIDDKSNWWNLYHYDLQSGETINVAPKKSEIGGPQWVFGIDGYTFGPKGSNEIYGYFDENLSVLNTKTQELSTISTDHIKTPGSGKLLPSDSIICSSNGMLYFISGSASQSSFLVRLDPKSGEYERIVTTSADIDDGYISIPEKITFPTSNNTTAYGYFYLPKNKDYSAPKDELPPLMVRAHGGPTSKAKLVLMLKHQYLTSRGFAVLDVDYRGSTGYGREYRDALKGNWGIYDVDDVVNGALHLVKSGKVDGNRLSIDGGSAGGFTVLAALTFKSVFQAGISLYGVSDLEGLTNDSHKFESRYLDSLIGPYPEMKQVYIDRSPIHHTQQLKGSIAFFQGDEDKVVPPNQSEDMFQIVKKKGFKTAYVLFQGEQHGFRNAKNIKQCIDGELYFLSKVFGFEANDIDVELEIFNM